MGRKSIPILLKGTSPEGETKTFTSIGEAAKELDLANVELVKHSMKREIEIGEYELEFFRTRTRCSP